MDGNGVGRGMACGYEGNGIFEKKETVYLWLLDRRRVDQMAGVSRT